MQSSSIALSQPISLTAQSRVEALDTQRGLVICLMALSHALEYISLHTYSNIAWNDAPQWLGTKSFELFHQAFISFLTSGGFFMMMGIGIALLFAARMQEGWSLTKICRYLISRGTFLVIVQFTILQLFEFMAEQKVYLYIGVLFSLGICMILAALLLYGAQQLASKIPYVYYILPLFFILIIPAIGHVVMQSIHAQGDALNWAQIIFFVGGKYTIGDFSIDIDFTPLPWFPAVAWGLVLGKIIIDYKNRAFIIMAQLALLFLLAWLLIRIGNIQAFLSIGDYKIFPSDTPITTSAFFIMSKYPPSISFFLWVLGINMALLSLWNWLYRLQIFSKFSEILQVFGRSALFFFIAHWFVFWGISLLLPTKFPSLSSELGIWLCGLMVLFFMCKYFYLFKMKQKRDSLWRMF